ncbi:APC membrane recruitment protein like [Actinidia chinensis var. chinensis]|uniref:APC membrane recruitment protein like n=1 Tax=Actinidia chinensis var. chinensis TaxID=1590841 RepID=A0A2R6R8M7_ACTCC|nr:APC membrane recruitment protein like [Actinidia chinensis var. chinensis]
MASLATQFSTFLFLCPLGIRRLLCSFSLYLKNPSLYRSRTWYFSEPTWKNIDFYTLLIALPFAAFSYLFFFLAFSGHPTHRFAFLQQSQVVSLFWVLLILIIFRENFDIPENFIFVFAGIAFLVDYMMMGQGITGIGGVVYELFGELTLVCAGSCLLLSIRPTSFLAEFLLSSGLVFKGTWALQIGLSLYTDAFALKGCDNILMSLAQQGLTDIVKCELEEDRLRGIALMNLLFIGHAIVVLVASFGLFGLLCRNRNLRCGEASGPLLAELESMTMQMHPLPEFELE